MVCRGGGRAPALASVGEEGPELALAPWVPHRRLNHVGRSRRPSGLPSLREPLDPRGNPPISLLRVGPP